MNRSRFILFAIVLVNLTLATGCLVVPERGYGYGYRHHHHYWRSR